MLLVTFSGLDGSGKTTHAVRSEEYLAGRGWRVRRLATARASAGGLLTFLRETKRHLGSSDGVGLRRRRHVHVPGGHGMRMTAHVRLGRGHGTGSLSECHGTRRTGAKRWWGRALFLARCLVYPVDCLALVVQVRILTLLGYTAVVCDRYVPDKIVNLPNQHGVLARLMYRLAPRPDLAFMIDVDPQVARRRRPEHEAGYHETKYAAYRRLAGEHRELKPIRGESVDEMQRQVEAAIDSAIARLKTTVPAALTP